MFSPRCSRQASEVGEGRNTRAGGTEATRLFSRSFSLWAGGRASHAGDSFTGVADDETCTVRVGNLRATPTRSAIR